MNEENEPLEGRLVHEGIPQNTREPACKDEQPTNKSFRETVCDISSKLQSAVLARTIGLGGEDTIRQEIAKLAELCKDPACKGEQPKTEAEEFAENTRKILQRCMTEVMRMEEEKGTDVWANVIWNKLSEACDIIERLEESERGLTVNHACQEAKIEDLQSQVERLEGEIRLRKKQADQIPLCPDCRDKVRGLPCLRCTIQRLRTLLADKGAELKSAKQPSIDFNRGWELARQGKPCGDLEDDELSGWKVFMYDGLEAESEKRKKSLQQIMKVAIGLTQTKRKLYERARDMQEMADEAL